MGRRKRRQRRKRDKKMDEGRRRDQDTVEIIEEILRRPQIEISQLRKVSAVRGLVNHRLRARVWPMLLGIDLENFDWGDYERLGEMDHKDTPTVKADIPRSMHQFTDGLSDKSKEEKRAALRRLLNAVVNYHDGDVHYYQGLHDIGAVLILTVGERLAFPLICKIATCQLRDCTRVNLDAVTELLRLIHPIVEMADPEVATLLQVMGVPCYFSLSWFITWFSHDVHSLPDIARLFDLFFSSHPMMPLYVGAAGIATAREELVGLDEMCELHSALVNLNIGKYISTDDLIRKALALYGQASPGRILRRCRMNLKCATAPDAFLNGDFWEVPDKPVKRNPLLMGDPVWWTMQTLTKGLVMSSQKGTPISTLSMVGVGVAAVLLAFKVMDSHMQGLQDHAWDSMFQSEL
ncbi:hypothetical protein BSKO_13004 [Bryopsis sp. KO-2023]|nr:hypothetical protein BSKO_13004 [Bryopsis sp. KO-2023]